MIIQIREGFKQRGFKIVIWFMLISMIVVFVPNIFRENRHLPVVATINNKSIEIVDYERRLYQETERYNMFRQQFGPQAEMYLKALGMNDPKVMALNGLVQEALVDQAADAMGIAISPDFIQEKLMDYNFITHYLADVIPYFLIDQSGVNFEKLNHYLRQQRLTMQDFEDLIEKKIKRNMVLSLIETAVYVPNMSIVNYYKHHYLGRKYAIISFPYQDYLKKAEATTLTESQIQEFYQKESNRYLTPESRTITLYTFDPKHYGLEVGSSEIQQYYNAHKSQFIQTPLQVQVRRILITMGDDEQKNKDAEQKILKIQKDLQLKPQSFEELARQFSEDTKTASKGGLVDFFKKGEYDSEFERAAFRLQNDGDISDVVSTQKGLEILQRVGRKQATYKPLEEVQETIKDIVYNQKFKTAFAQDAAKIGSTIAKNEQTKAFESFAEQKKAAVQTLSNMSNDSSPLALKIFKARAQDWIYVIADGKGLIAQVVTIHKSAKPELDSVKTAISKDMYQAQALSLLKQDLHKAQTMDSLESIKKDFPLVKIKTTEFVNLQDEKDIAELQGIGVSADKLASLDQVGNTFITYADKNGYLVRVMQVEEFTPEKVDSQRSTIHAVLENEQKQALLSGFIASLYRNAKINITQSLVNLKEEMSL